MALDGPAVTVHDAIVNGATANALTGIPAGSRNLLLSGPGGM